MKILSGHFARYLKELESQGVLVFGKEAYERLGIKRSEESRLRAGGQPRRGQWVPLGTLSQSRIAALVDPGAFGSEVDENRARMALLRDAFGDLDAETWWSIADACTDIALTVDGDHED